MPRLDALTRRRFNASSSREVLLAVLGVLALSLVVASSAAPAAPGKSGGPAKLAVTTVTPSTGATLSGRVTWQVNVSGGSVARVDFAIDGATKWSQTSSPYLYGGATGSLDTTTLTNGAHTLTATAYPVGKGPSAKTSISVTVANGTSAVAPTWSVPPSVSGSAVVGQTLSSTTGSWTGTSPIAYAYQWLRCDSSGANCTAITGATASTYVLSSSDQGSTLRTRVTASNIAGSASSLSSQTADVAGGGTGSIYWGADVDGATYNYLYGGSTYGNPPWDDTSWNLFESHTGKKLSILSWANAAPWVHDFTYYASMQEKVRTRGDLSLISMNSGSVPLSQIAKGAYDSYFTTWAREAAAWGHPFFLRWDWEMNGNWFPWSPGVNGTTASDYVAAWRHIHDLFAQAGATNVTWVWCPNIDPGNMWTPLSQLYPGSAYVDWTCLDAYNKGSVYTPPGWRSFSTLVSSSYSNLLQLAPGKPVMIAETSSEESGGSKASWITDLLGTLPQSFPQIKALVWYNHRAYDSGLNYWWPWEIESSGTSQAAFANGIASSYYAPGGSFGNLPLHTPISPPS
jgi:glycosyl hydrolase family 26/Big-like domain-containing protein